MSKKVKILIFVAIVAIVLYAIWYKKKKANAITESLSLPNIAPAPPVYSDKFPLNIGSRGENVKKLQMALNKINAKPTYLQPTPKITPLVVDGVYGKQTETAILTLCGYMYITQSGLTEQNFNSIIQKSNQ